MPNPKLDVFENPNVVDPVLISAAVPVPSVKAHIIGEASGTLANSSLTKYSMERRKTCFF